MRYCFVLLIALFVATLCAAAQNEPNKLGKIDKADLLLTDCDFDKGAPAIKLIDSRFISYTQGGENVLKMMAERRTRIKILKEKGLAYANVHIPYVDENNSEKITNIQAYTYNLAANGSVTVTKVDKKSIFSKRINKNTNEIIIAFPRVKTGSVIEYSYTLERDNIGYIEDWYFQNEIPVRYSAFDLEAPLLLNFKVDSFIYAGVEKAESLIDDRIIVDGMPRYVKLLQQSYVMRNLPGIADEPFMTSKNDYLQRISFQLAQSNEGRDVRTSWDDVVARLYQDEDFGEEIRKNIPAVRTLITEALPIQDTLDRMVRVYNMVRNAMDWDGNYSIYALNGVRTAWDNKTGSSGDLNIILINLLKQAGIRTTPLLVSTRSNGMVNTQYPSERQFNTIMAYVAIGSNYYVLDATDKYSPWQLLPYDICNSWGLRLTGKATSEWVELLPQYTHSQIAIVQATMDTAGVMKGTATVESYHYAKAPLSKYWQEDEAGFINNYITAYSPNITINQLHVQHADNDSLPLEQQIQFTLPLYTSGNYSHFSFNLFSGLAENPFISNERKSDIDFGCPQDYTLYGSYTLPQTHAFETTSGNFRIIMPDTSIIFNLNKKVEENLLIVRVNVQFKKSNYLAANYPALQDFYKKMFLKLREPIIVRKK